MNVLNCLAENSVMDFSFRTYCVPSTGFDLLEFSVLTAQSASFSFEIFPNFIGFILKPHQRMQNRVSFIHFI